MKTINIVQPASLKEALAILKKSGAQAMCIAGGTDVLIAMRYEKLPAGITQLVDISLVPELKGIREEGDEIILAAGSTHTDIEENPLLQKYVPLLSDASRGVGSPQIRNRGTVGGNLVTAAQCADTIPPLIVLDAVVTLKKADSERSLAIADFLTGPKTTAIKNDEILTEIRFRKPAEGSKMIFSKLIRREAVAKTRISVAAIARQDPQGQITYLSLSPGSVTARACRFTTVEAKLTGTVATAETIREASEEAARFMIEQTGRRWSTPYKEPVLTTLVERALLDVLEGQNA